MNNNAQAENLSNITPLVKDILQDALKLFRQEITLARTEIKQDVTSFSTAFIMLAVGALIGFLSLILLCFTFVYALDYFFPSITLWGSFLILTCVMAVISLITISVSKNRIKKVNLLPNETIETIKEHKGWNTQKI